MDFEFLCLGFLWALRGHTYQASYNADNLSDLVLLSKLRIEVIYQLKNVSYSSRYLRNLERCLNCNQLPVEAKET